eukprot:8815901-Pyramimonas_sp.AAC.2
MEKERSTRGGGRWLGGDVRRRRKRQPFGPGRAGWWRCIIGVDVHGECCVIARVPWFRAVFAVPLSSAARKAECRLCEGAWRVLKWKEHGILFVVRIPRPVDFPELGGRSFENWCVCVCGPLEGSRVPSPDIGYGTEMWCRRASSCCTVVGQSQNHASLNLCKT